MSSTHRVRLSLICWAVHFFIYTHNINFRGVTMPIKEAEKSYDHDKIEKKVQKFWKEEDTFKKVNELREKGPRYSFLDGPPYCSGKIHLGTAWNKVIKDTYLRYKSMNGFSLRRQAGWDMHGLPIENKVEHLLNIQSCITRIFGRNYIISCRNHVNYRRTCFLS